MKKTISYFAAALLFVGAIPVAKAAALIDLGLGTMYDGISNTSVKYDSETNSDIRVKAKAENSDTSETDDNATSSEDRVSQQKEKSSDFLSESDDILIRSNTRVNGAENAQENANANAFMNANPNSALDASRVSTKDELEAFASSTVANDENIDELHFSKDKVEIGYKEHGKFLGLFRTSYKIHVIVNADGSVDVKYPWYAFLFAASKASVQSEIDSAVGSIISQASTTGSVSFSANEAAEITSKVREILYARFGEGLGITGSSTASNTNGSQ